MTSRVYPLLPRARAKSTRPGRARRPGGSAGPVTAAGSVKVVSITPPRVHPIARAYASAIARALPVASWATAIRPGTPLSC